jgi:hypothetical protein
MHDGRKYAVALAAIPNTMAAFGRSIIIYSAKLFMYGSVAAVFLTSLRLDRSMAVESQEPLVNALR